MTREQVTRHLCATMSLAYMVIGDYTHPSDGVCDRCPAERDPQWNFRNEGHMAEYVRQAVVERLLREGHEAERVLRILGDFEHEEQEL